MTLVNDTIDVESVVLGYSASLLGCDHANGSNESHTLPFQHDTSSFGELNKSKWKTYSSFSSFSMNCSSLSKSPIVLEKWYLQPVRGSQAIKVCGTKVSDGKTHKSSAIKVRVNSRCVLTTNGSMYQIIGTLQHAVNMPVWFEEKFFNGFPSAWQSYVDNYLEWISQKSSGDDSDSDKLDKCTDSRQITEDKIKLELHRWVLQFCGNHLMVEGYAIAPDGKPRLYRTGPIVDAIDKTIVYTTARSYYRLKDSLNVEAAVQGGIPLWFAKKFHSGFPANWRDMIDVYRNYRRDVTKDLSKTVDAVEEMSLLACEGFAPVRQPSSLTYHDSAVQSPNTSGHGASSGWSNASVQVNVPDTIAKRKLKRCQTRKYSRRNSTLKKSSSKSKNLSEVASGKNSRRKSKLNCKMTPTDQENTKRKKNVQKEKVAKATLPSSLCSPLQENGLYRTRSGRHVFPPLQHWTFQRLSTECDADGNELVVFQPGNKSELAEISPACDYLRESDWIHKKFIEDQLFHSPSFASLKQLKVTKTRRKLSTSVENISESGGGVDLKSNRENIFPVLPLQATPCKTFKPKHNKSFGNTNSTQKTTTSSPERVVFGDLTNFDVLCETPRLAKPVASVEKADTVGVETRAINFSSSPDVSASILSDFSLTECVVEISRAVLLEDVVPLNLKQPEVDKAKSADDEVASQPLDNGCENTSKVVKEASVRKRGRPRKRTRTKKVVVAKAIDCDKSEKRQELKETTPKPRVPPKRLKSVGVSSIVLSERKLSLRSSKVNAERNLPSKNVRSTLSVADQKATRSEKAKNKKLKKSSSVASRTEKSNLRGPSIVCTDASTRTSQRHSQVVTDTGAGARAEGVDVPEIVTETKKGSAKPNPKNAKKKPLKAVTARRGTVKRRQQTKEALDALNQVGEEQDFFSLPASSHTSFASDCFKLNTGDGAVAATPYTPVSKLPSGFEKHVITPAWFKTPSGSEALSLATAETPTHVGESSLFVQTSQVADKCIVQMQRESKMSREPQKRLNARRPTPLKKRGIAMSSDLFQVETDHSRNSSDDDDYFSE